MFFWNKKKKNQNISINDAVNNTVNKNNICKAKNEHTDKSESYNSTVKQGNLGFSIDAIVDEMFNEQLKKGSFDDLPGKGKPLRISDTDALNSILKEANVLPQWLTSQHEIKNQIQKLLTVDPNNEKQIEEEIHELNKKIMKYNNQVPSSILQKNKITKKNMVEQYKSWL